MWPFFVTAMRSPSRQRSFRRLAAGHALATSLISYGTVTASIPGPPGFVASIALVIGIVEGAALVGWRLTQLPKSQALEFLLVSPVRPRRVFLAELATGVGRFLFVQLAGLPAWGLAILWGPYDFYDLVPLAVMPAAWGIATGVLLTAWVYEPLPVRRMGELTGLVGVMTYLVVGLLAGEHLRLWLEALPDRFGRVVFDTVMTFHNGNPFGVVRYWFEPGRADAVAWERFSWLHFIAGLTTVVAAGRAACRLHGHFHDLQYTPQSDGRPNEVAKIADRPLSWWAVRRVMKYSGRVNLWLAVGVAGLYASRIVAGESWPAGLGNLVFVIFEQWGGPAGMVTVLVVLACVPAVFQYGLWDATPADRIRRLELLLLSDLTGRDYAHAALAASWVRGRGYLLGAGMLWLAVALSGRNDWSEVIASALGSAVLWGLSFAVGFRSFAAGNQTNGIASIMTLGLPCVLVFAVRSGYRDAAQALPQGWVYGPVASGITWQWYAGTAIGAALTTGLIRASLKSCVNDLQKWYDRNHGLKVAE
jgi:hypothetical protein